MISGTIGSLGTDSIIIKTAAGDDLTVKVTGETKIQQTVTGSSAYLQSGVFLGVTGDADSNGTIIAKSIEPKNCDTTTTTNRCSWILSDFSIR